MKKFKLVTVVGTRPEIIRLSRIIYKLDLYMNHVLIHTGQNYDYELNEIFFEDLSIRKPDYFLNSAKKNATETIGQIIIDIDKILEKEKPQALFVLGDTNSCISVIAAKRRKIPVFHMEAGNRCFDLRVPEEINRKIVDHTADINLTYSSLAKNYLIMEGIRPEQVINVGSPMFEVLSFFKDKIKNSSIVEDLELTEKKYFLVSIHREENVDNIDNFKKIIKILNSLVDKYNFPIVFSTHPRTRKKIENLNLKLSPKIALLKPLNFTSYNKLQICSKAVLSDSGTINEESSILNFPALNLRETFERPEAMEEGAVMMTGMNMERVMQSLDILEKQSNGTPRTLELVKDYSKRNISEKIPRIILSYTDYINKFIWKKDI